MLFRSNVEGSNYDAKFNCTESSTTERIYSAFGQEPWYNVRIGRTGWSGNVLSEAYEYYNSYVSKVRRSISRNLKKIFDRWYEKANVSDDYEIEPLIYVSNNSTGNTIQITQNNGTSLNH